MILHRKFFGLPVYLALGLFAAGCSGINTTQSVSPASFFLPGLLKADPPPATNDMVLPEMSAPKLIAQAR